jgi:hypothetical protein
MAAYPQAKYRSFEIEELRRLIYKAIILLLIYFDYIHRIG